MSLSCNKEKVQILTKFYRIIADFQRGQTQTFIKHIEFATTIARKDPDAILVFSGGQTSKVAGPISEGQSYWSLAEAQGELIQDEKGRSLEGRMIVEEFARDSYENLLFSIARFNEYVGSYPTIITVVGHEFKKARYENLHRAAIHYPAAQFRYVGFDPPQIEKKLAADGEAANAGIPFSKDPHGCTNRILVSKRRDRNPFRRAHPYALSCPELYKLLSVCSMKKVQMSLFDDLPWNRATVASASATSTNTAAGVAASQTENSVSATEENIPSASWEPVEPREAKAKAGAEVEVDSNRSPSESVNDSKPDKQEDLETIPSASAEHAYTNSRNDTLSAS